jgi:hypothetical protein
MEQFGIGNPSDWIDEHLDILKKAQQELAIAGSEYSQIQVTGERTMRVQGI